MNDETLDFMDYVVNIILEKGSREDIREFINNRPSNLKVFIRELVLSTGGPVRDYVMKKGTPMFIDDMNFVVEEIFKKLKESVST